MAGRGLFRTLESCRDDLAEELKAGFDASNNGELSEFFWSVGVDHIAAHICDSKENDENDENMEDPDALAELCPDAFNLFWEASIGGLLAGIMLSF